MLVMSAIEVMQDHQKILVARVAGVGTALPVSALRRRVIKSIA